MRAHKANRQFRKKNKKDEKSFLSSFVINKKIHKGQAILYWKDNGERQDKLTTTRMSVGLQSSTLFVSFAM